MFLKLPCSATNYTTNCTYSTYTTNCTYRQYTEPGEPCSLIILRSINVSGLIIVSGYNNISTFLIKNELQSPYIKNSLVKPQQILQVTPLPADNRTWYTPPTMIIGHVAEAHLIRCYLVHVIVKIKYICDNQYLCHNKLTQSNHSSLDYTYQTHIT